MLLVFPLALISMGLVVRGVPSFSQSTERADIVQAFMHVLRNRSTLACLVGNMLAFVSWSIFLSYSASFYRQHFLLDTAFVSFAFVGTSMLYIVGGILGGRLVQRYGRKTLPVICAVIHGLSLLGFMNVSQLLFSMVLWSVSAFSNAVRFSSYNSLVIEQVPAYQGTVMSLSQVSADLGSVIGTGIGGMILLFSDYSTVGLLGLMSVVAGLVFHFFTSDPVNQS
jgi:predicted MFS family arabinose efflux permease